MMQMMQMMLQQQCKCTHTVRVKHVTCLRCKLVVSKCFLSLLFSLNFLVIQMMMIALMITLDDYISLLQMTRRTHYCVMLTAGNEGRTCYGELCLSALC